MAENKKSIVVYSDWIELFENLTDDEAGKLIKHFFRYVNDKNPIAPDRLTELSFIPIKQSLKRDLQKWEKTLEGRSRAGKASAEARKLSSQQISTNSTNVENLQQSSTNPTDSVSVSVSVSDSVSVSENVSDILLKKETKENTLVNSVDLKNQPDHAKIDFNKLVSFFNANRGALPEVKKLSEARKKRIFILEKQYGKESIRIAIEKTRESEFLQGNNSSNWIASFDWIFKPANFLKILEDNYANREKPRTNNTPKSDIEHKQDAVNAVNAMFGIQ